MFDYRFLTCSTSDDWPKYAFNNQMFILNVDDSSKNESHWCAFYKYNNKIYSYDGYNRNVKTNCLNGGELKQLLMLIQIEINLITMKTFVVLGVLLGLLCLVNIKQK